MQRLAAERAGRRAAAVAAPALALLLALLLGLLLAARPAGAAELLMFELPGCPWCERWDAEVGPAYRHSSEGRRAPLRRLGMRERPAGLVLAGPITHSPTFVLVDQGREVGRIVGYPGADFFWGLLGELIGRLDGAVPRRSDAKSRGRVIGPSLAIAACPNNIQCRDERV